MEKEPFDELETSLETSEVPETQTEEEQPNKNIEAENKPEVPWYDPSKPEMTAEEAAAHWANRYKEEQKYIQEKTEQLKQYEGIDLENYQTNEQLINVIAQNPELMSIVEKHLRGETASDEIPPKPIDFDPEDIFDPTTPSGKWYQQVDELKEQKRINQILKVLDEKEQEKTKKQQEEIAKQQALEIRNERLEFINKRQDLSLAEKEEFLNFADKGPEVIGIKGPLKTEYLYQFYSILKNGNKVDIDSKIKNAVNHATPPEVTQVSATIEEPKPEERKFIEGLKGRTQNILGI